MELEFIGVAEEAGEAVHHDDIEGLLDARRIAHEPLQLRAVLVRARSAALGVLRRDRPALARAIGGALAGLVRYGKLFLRLPCRRDAQVARRSQARKSVVSGKSVQGRGDLGGG